MKFTLTLTLVFLSLLASSSAFAQGSISRPAKAGASEPAAVRSPGGQQLPLIGENNRQPKSPMATSAGEGGLPVTRAGRPAAVIVLPNDADAVHREAASLLQTFIRRMSGAQLTVLRERELTGARVVRGWIEEGSDADVMIGDEGIPGESPIDINQPRHFILVGAGTLARQLGVNADELGPGGIRLKSTGNALVLLGGPERVAGQPGSDGGGIRHAALELLERLGCHYLWPGELGMVVPDRPTITVASLDVTYTPPIRRRGIRWGQNVGFDRFDTGLERLGMTAEQWQSGYRKAVGEEAYISWSDWHRLGGSMPTFGHAGAGLRNGEQYMESNPEWFAMQADGTRWQAGSSRWRLCKSNEQLIEHVANDIIRQRNEDPGLTLVSLDSNDGAADTGWCQCDTCKALDPPDGPTVRMLIFPTTENRTANRREIDHPSLTDRMVFYWNSIAERVTRVHPDLLFGVSAYSRYSNPPVERRLHPNLVVRYVPPTTEGWRGWQRMGARRVYWRPNILLAGWNDGKLRSNVGDLAGAMSYFLEAGMMQTDINTIRHWWGVHGLNYYAAARLCWNPHLSVDQIIADYARYGFGRAAPHIQRYFQRVEQLTESFEGRVSEIYQNWSNTPGVMAELRGLLNAGEAAANDPQVVERIAFLRVGLNFTELQELLSDKTSRARQGLEFDRNLARRLVDLNCLVLRDIVLNHNLVANTPLQIWRSATNAQFSAIGGRTVEPSDPALLERVGDPRYGMTGREQSIDELLQAFGL